MRLVPRLRPSFHSPIDASENISSLSGAWLWMTLSSSDVPHYQLRAFHIAYTLVGVNGILLLGVPVVVVVVVVPEIYFGGKSVALERRGEHFHEVGLVPPLHNHRRAVASVERFVLRADGIDVDAVGFHGLNKLHEVVGIVLIVGRVEVAAGPCGGVVLHPAGCRPRRSDDFQVGVDGQYFLQNGYNIVGFIAMKGEMLESRSVAKCVDGAREVAAPYRDAGIAHSIAFCTRVGLL